MGTGFLWTERSISVSAALLRQTSRDGLSLSNREEETGLRELLRGIWRRRLISSPFFLTRDFAKMSVGCVILACTLLVGTSSVRWVNFFMSFSTNSTMEVLHCCSAYSGFAALHEPSRVAVKGSLSPRSVALKATWCVKSSLLRWRLRPTIFLPNCGEKSNWQLCSLASPSSRLNKLQCIVAEDRGF